jgi:antitoxin ParD1/3/4
MTRYEKIAISLPLRAAERVRRAVREGRAPSASAYIAAALEARYSREETIAMLHEMLEESGGPPTAEEGRWVTRALTGKQQIIVSPDAKHRLKRENVEKTKKTENTRRRSRSSR